MPRKGRESGPDRAAILHAAREEVRRTLGKRGLLAQSAAEALERPSVWASTGALSLDRLLRGRNPGGVPVGPRYGRIVHIAGMWSTGKSLLLDHLFKSVQDLGGYVLCLETEATRDPYFAERIGLDLTHLDVQRPATLELVFDGMLRWHAAIRKHDPEAPVLIGLDSIDSAGAGKSREQGLSEGKGWMYGGGRSEVLGEGLRRVTAELCGKYPTTLVLLNQTRTNPNVLFGNNKYTPGGLAPHFYASLELLLTDSPLGTVRGKYTGAKLTDVQRRRFGFTKTERGDVVGKWVTAKVTKSKVSALYGQTADFYIDFRSGVSKYGGLLKRLLAEGLAALTSQDAIVFDGQEFEDEAAFIAYVEAHPETLDRESDRPAEAEHAVPDGDGGNRDDDDTGP